MRQQLAARRFALLLAAASGLAAVLVGTGAIGPGDGPQPYGSTLTIQVSAGLPQVTVPDVTGKKAAEATAILEAAGLEVDATSFFGNKVRNQVPAAGEVVEQGSTVKILVCF